MTSINSYRLPKDYESIVQEVLSRPISKIAASLPGVEINEMRHGISMLISFIQKEGYKLGDNRFVVRILDKPNNSESGTLLSISEITTALMDDYNVITISSNGYIVHPHNLINLDNESLTDFSEGKVIAFIDCGQYLEFYSNCRYIKEIDVFNPRSTARQPTKLSRLAKDFPLIVLDHYQKHVKYAQSTEHWDNRSKRILRCTPQKTEFIFHKDLWNWLEDHRTDFVVYGESQKLSPDRTDIELITIKGAKRYILEVKWLGKNANKTEYKEDRIEEGIKQVKEYLKRDRHTLVAALIVYNGRNEEDYKNLEKEAIHFCDDWCELARWGKEDLPERGKCMVLLLNNRTASTA